ncbi:sigma 54-interacting transcriptional regulator [Myxococcota bacterium]|nr:sigma 54-interacting transcriptional regulator [Myxococcota bacterium]
MHAGVRPVDGRYVVEDLGGHNGTFVDGARVGEPVELGRHAVLAIGDTLLVVDEDPHPDHLPAAGHADPRAVHEWVGSSFSAERVRRALATVATAHGSVLLLGQTGSGKEVAARAIHRLSGRAGPWVPVNCAAIPHDIAEAEFFGYKRGAFTGAVSDRDGFFVQASGGTLFLDEVGDLPVPLQAKLLRVLEDGFVQSLGGGAPRKVDLRVVAATHVDLDRAGFRRDLLARLGDWTLHLPPLSERRVDILPLWEHFVRAEMAQHLSSRTGVPLDSVDLAALVPRPATAELSEALLLHDWPMNVRELQKLARRLSTLAAGSAVFDLPLLPEVMQRRLASRPSREAPVSADLSPSTTLPPGITALAGAALSAATASSASSAPSAPRADGGAPIADDVAPAPLVGPNDRLGTDPNAPDRQTLEAALARAKGNVSLVSEQNGWHRTQVYRWIRRAGIDPDQYR